MHAPLRQPIENTPMLGETEHLTWRGGIHGARYFDSARTAEWIQNFNATGNAEALNRLLEHVMPLAKSILEYRTTTKLRISGRTFKPDQN